MSRKLKTTGCFRLFLFLLIFAPIAYFGARAINGEDTFAPLRKLIEKGEMSRSEPSPTTGSDATERMQIDQLKQEIDALQEEIRALKKENAELRKDLEEN